MALHFLNSSTHARCSLCGRVLADIGTLTTTHWHCWQCNVRVTPEITLPAYEYELAYIDPATGLEYGYHHAGVWTTLDNAGNVVWVEELFLPGNLITVDEWREQQRAADRLTTLYGSVSQLSLLEAAL